MKLTHRFALLTPEKRPQDPNMDGTGLRFETMEHGGEYPDTMPQAIKLVDAEGRSCIYVPITQDGKSSTAKATSSTWRMNEHVQRTSSQHRTDTDGLAPKVRLSPRPRLDCLSLVPIHSQRDSQFAGLRADGRQGPVRSRKRFGLADISAPCSSASQPLRLSKVVAFGSLHCSS